MFVQLLSGRWAPCVKTKHLPTTNNNKFTFNNENSFCDYDYIVLKKQLQLSDVYVYISRLNMEFQFEHKTCN